MNDHSRELMHMTTAEKAAYNRDYYRRNKQYWVDYYKTGHGTGRKPGSFSGSTNNTSQYYNGIDRYSVRSAWDTRRSQIKKEQRDANDSYKQARQKYKDAKKRGYYEETGVKTGVSPDTGEFTMTPYSYKVDFTKDDYKSAVKRLKNDLRAAARNQIETEKAAIRKQKQQLIEEIMSRMETIKLSDLSSADKKAALKEGKAIIREMKRGYRKHMFSLFVSQIRTYGFNPVW